MKYELSLNDRAFKAIINGTKKVEIRANTNGKNFSEYKEGDIICFTNSVKEQIFCKVKMVNHYSCPEELFKVEGTLYTTSSTNDYNTAVERIYALTGYKEEIANSGVYAIHIEYIGNNEKDSLNNYCMLEVAFGNEDELNEAMKKLLDKKLVSSCQNINSKSFWNWNNERENGNEYVVIMKTKLCFVDEIYDMIKNIHSYECFEFAIYNINSINKEYLEWIDRETR